MRMPGEQKSSANAGELAPALRGKVSIKQYYSGALAMKNVEPVPQSGFTLMPGSRHIDVGASATCRKGVLRVDGSLSYILHFTVGEIRVYRNAVTKVATIAAAWVTGDVLPEISFFGEANTFGVWHESWPIAKRIFRDPANDSIWTVDNWPYEDVPEVDLGGVYPTTDDYWSLYIRWSSVPVALAISVTVDGNTTSAVRLVNGSNAIIAPGSATAADWHNLATLLRPLIRGLPGLNNDVDIQYDPAQDAGAYRAFNIVFHDSLAGREYQVDANIVNTSEASVIASHIEIGQTEGEPLISVARGGFSGMEVFQDRAIYYAPKAKRAAVAMSEAGEYFNLNIKDQADTGARLEALRTITSERILHIVESKYLLAFTDQAEWFASNRTIERNTPLNWVRTTENGARPNCRPVILEGFVWYVNKDGSMLFSTSYDDVSTSFLADPESLLATHLIYGIKRKCVQKKIGSNNVARLWMLRDDGRLICAIVIKSQEILAMVEWIPAGGGLVKEIVVDGQERVQITVQRGSAISEELLEEASVNLFHSSLTVMTDLAGEASGLGVFEGKTVWARINGYILGPFTVTAGKIQTGEAAASAQVGLWQPPNFESMPFVKVLPNNEILNRPGRCHTVILGLIDTESVAVGANGSPPKNVPLQRATDDLSQSPEPVTRNVTVSGIDGVVEGPTVRITQTRPGMLTLRDYVVGAKL